MKAENHIPPIQQVIARKMERLLLIRRVHNCLAALWIDAPNLYPTRLRRMMTLSASPIPASVESNDVPPELRNGRVKPVTGMSRKFMPIDTTVWKKINAATP